MELKERLQDYTRAEFVNFVKQIKLAKTSKAQHDNLILHFDRLVKHPKGADLLFYPESDGRLDGFGDAVDVIVHNVKKYHNANGQLAFKDDALPQPRSRVTTPPSSAADRARKASSEKLFKVQEVIAQINQAKLNADNAFINLETLLNAAQAKTPRTLSSETANNQQLALLADELSRLEAAQYGVIRSLYEYDFIKLKVQFAKNDADRSISWPHLDRQIQASILEQMTRSNNQYLEQGSALKIRQQNLHLRTELTLKDVENYLIRVAAAIGAGPIKEAITFNAPASDCDTMPRVLTTNTDHYNSFEMIQSGLKHAIRSAIGGLAWTSTSAGDEKTVKYASVMSFRFDKPGLGEPYAVGVPLSELTPTEGRDWQYLADTEAEVNLDFRMGSGITPLRFGKLSYGLKDIYELAHIFVMSTNSPYIESNVKVRAAVWEPASNSYHFARPGAPSRAVSWALQYPSNTVGSSVPQSTPYHGALSAVAVPTVEVHPCVDDLHFDDCIVVFPRNSGIEPVYVMFKGSREHAGAASGTGQVVANDWLQSSTDPTGAPIPTLIANQLRGKVFKRFSAFRELFWTAVANTSDLSMQFPSEDLAAMKEGRAPYSPAQNDKTDHLELHHIITPERGGNIYDMDNIRIMARNKKTPQK